MASFAELLVRVGGDATGFNSAMNSVATKTDQTVKQVETKLGGIGKLFEGMGGRLAAAIGFGALATSIVSAATKFEQASFTIRRATGATGAELEALDKSFARLYSSSARSAEEVAGALAHIKAESKLSGTELEALTQQNLRFAKVTGQDVKQSIESTQDVFKNWNIATRNQSAALDILYRVIQETHINSAALTSQLASAGPIVRTLGLSFKETAALIGNMEEKGVNADKVFASLAAGFKKLAKDSADPRQALFDLIDRMKQAKDQTEAAAMAAPIFGRNAVVLADAVKRGAMDVQEFTAQLDKNKDSVAAAAKETESLKNTFVKFQHQLESTVFAHKDLIITAGLAVPALGTLGKTIGGVISAASTKVAAGGILGLFGAAVIASIYATIKGLDELEAKYDSLEKRAKGKKEYLPGQKPEEQFTSFEGEELSRGLGFRVAIKQAAETYEQALKRMEEQQKQLNKAVQEAELRYNAVARAYNAGTVSLGELSKAHVRLKLAQDAANPQRLIEWHQKMNDEYLKWSAKMQEVSKKSQKMRDSYQRFVDAVESGNVEAQLLRISASSETLQSHLSKLKIPEAIIPPDLHRQTEQAIEDEKLLGVEGENTAKKMREAYERHVSQGLFKSEHQRLVALRNVWKQEIEEREAVGQKITEAERKRFEELERVLGRHIQRGKTFWSEYGKEIKSIVKHWATDIGRDLWDTILGKGRRDFNRNLDEQRGDLEKSLTEQTAEWEQYQTDVAAGHEIARKKYESTLAEEYAALQASLEERRAEYANAEAETERALSETRDEYARDLAEELADLADSLEERRTEYWEYVDDINTKLAETRQEHADRLAEQLRDLEDTLNDKRDAYDDYVRDVNKKLSRVGEDYAESLDDETKQTKAGIEDKQQEYDRDEEDILQRIARLKKAGKKEQDEEIQDLRKSLKRKREDLEEYIREQNSALEEYKDDAKRRYDRETLDLQEALAQRTLEWNKYQQENATKRGEAIAESTASLAKEERDLQESLNKRTKDWEKYQQDNAKKVDEAYKKYSEGLEKEETKLRESLDNKKKSLDKYVEEAGKKWDKVQRDALAELNEEERNLQESLNNRRSEYDKFVTDVNTKLDAIKEAHRTAWDDIGGFMVGAFERAGESIMTFITTHLMGKLLDALTKGKLVDAIDGLARKVAGIFTGAGVSGTGEAAESIGLPGGTVQGPGQGTGEGGGTSKTSGGGSLSSGIASFANAFLGGFDFGYGLGKDLRWGSTEENSFYIKLNTRMINEWLNHISKYQLSDLSEIRASLSHLHGLFTSAFQGGPFATMSGATHRLMLMWEGNYAGLPQGIHDILNDIRSLVSQIRDLMGTQSEPQVVVVKERAATGSGEAITDTGTTGTATGPRFIEPPVAPSADSGKTASMPKPNLPPVEQLLALLRSQEQALANAMIGLDPNNAAGNAKWADAYKQNTGSEYMEWIRKSVERTRGMLDEWGAYQQSLIKRVEPPAPRFIDKLQAHITVNLDGRQVGNAFIDNLALVGVSL